MIIFLFSLPSSPPPQPASRRQSWPGGEAETERAPARWAQPNVGGKATANQRGKQGRFQLLIAAAAATVLSRAFYTLHSFLWLFHSITIHTLKYESTLRSCLKWQTSCCSCVFAVCRSVFSKGFKEAREGALISLRRIHVRVCVCVCMRVGAYEIFTVPYLFEAFSWTCTNLTPCVLSTKPPSPAAAAAWAFVVLLQPSTATHYYSD